MRRKHVLIVEDDGEIRSSVADVLNLEGFEVHTAKDGLDALEQLRAGEMPDIILLDMMMPVMDGWGFMSELRKIPEFAQMPVVIFSAYGNPEEMAARLNAADYLRKPFGIDELMAVVHRRMAAE